jgi:hypothetical protein
MRLLPNVVRGAGLLVGLAVTGLLVGSWQVAAGDENLGASVRVTAGGRGELEVSPAGPVASATALRAGGAALTGNVDLRNITGVPLSLVVRVQPADSGLDGKLRVQVRDGDLMLVDGRLGEARAGTPLVIPSGENRTLDVRVWVPAGTTGYRGLHTDIAITTVLPERG